jgi:hypothetical protein
LVEVLAAGAVDRAVRAAVLAGAFFAAFRTADVARGAFFAFPLVGLAFFALVTRALDAFDDFDALEAFDAFGFLAFFFVLAITDSVARLRPRWVDRTS